MAGNEDAIKALTKAIKELRGAIVEQGGAITTLGGMFEEMTALAQATLQQNAAIVEALLAEAEEETEEEGLGLGESHLGQIDHPET